jgi:hypothetical protein
MFANIARTTAAASAGLVAGVTTLQAITPTATADSTSQKVDTILAKVEGIESVSER